MHLLRVFRGDRREPENLELWVSNNIPQPSFTADQLKDGPTYHLEGAGP